MKADELKKLIEVSVGAAKVNVWARIGQVDLELDGFGHFDFKTLGEWCDFSNVAIGSYVGYGGFRPLKSKLS